MLNNAAFKHVDNDTDLPKTLDYVSQEIENKFRAERFRSGAAGWKTSAGVSAEYAKYNNSTKNEVYIPGQGPWRSNLHRPSKWSNTGPFSKLPRPC